MTAPYSKTEDSEKESPRKGNPGPRKGKEKLALEDLEGILQSYQQDSIDFVDQVLSPERAKAHSYYKGRPFGNEEPGRSQVVMTDVADAISGMMPELMRIFTGPKHYVEFEPTRRDNVKQALLKTDFTRYVFEQDNPGFKIIYESLWDGLVKKTGIVKWGWEDHSFKCFSLRHLTQDQLDAIESDENATVSLIEAEEEKVTVYPSADDMAAWAEAVKAAQQAGQRPPKQPQPTEEDAFSCEVTYQFPTGRVRVWAVPPEELLVLREGRDITAEGTLFAAHRMKKTRGELIAMGIDPDEIDEHGGAYSSLDYNAEQIERTPDEVVEPEKCTPGDEHFKHDYIENYIVIDFNGDGYSELRMIGTLGPSAHIVKGKNKVISERPFAVFSPYLEPHAIIGRSVADRTMDLQKIDSALVRSGLDSLAASIFPRSAYQDGMVSVADLNNTEIGSSIRTVGEPNRVLQTFSHNFNGKEIFPFLQFMKQAKEERTGVNNGAAGLDMDALQSTTPSAAEAAITSNKMQVELIARVYAEQLLKPLFKGIARLLHENQPNERVVRLRGGYEPIDPRAWDMNMDVVVNVALGRFEERKLATLVNVKNDQDALLALFKGQANPIVSIGQAARVRHDILKLQGILDTDSYYKDIPLNFELPPPPPQKSEAQIIAEGEQAVKKIEVLGKLAIAQEELKLKRTEIETKAQLEMAKLKAAENPDEKLAEIHAKMQQAMAEIEAKIAGIQAEIQAKMTLAREQMDLDLQLARERNALDMQLAREKQAGEMQIAREKTDADVEAKKEVARTNAESKERVEANKPEPAKPEKPAPAPKMPDINVTVQVAPGAKKKVKKTGEGEYEVSEES